MKRTWIILNKKPGNYLFKFKFFEFKFIFYIFLSNLYKQENYQSAIGVYNHAVRIFPKVPAYVFFF